MSQIIENGGFIYFDISDFDKDILIENVGVIFEQFEGNDKEVCEALIQSKEDLESVLNTNGVIVYEVGKKDTLISDWQEAKERNNETRSFDGWITDKVINLF